MANVLHVQASPMGDLSYSTRLARTFLEAYRAAHPGDEVETLDLWAADLPEFDFTAASGKYKIMRGQPHSDAEARAWERVIAEIERLKAADKLVISSPMWNFGIPYRLKQWIDVVVQPTYTFSFDPQKGYAGLVTGRPAALLLARGGEYPPGSDAAAADHQRSYLELVLGFIGFTRVEALVVEPTLHGGPEVAEERLREQEAAARELASRF